MEGATVGSKCYFLWWRQEGLEVTEGNVNQINTTETLEKGLFKMYDLNLKHFKNVLSIFVSDAL